MYIAEIIFKVYWKESSFIDLHRIWLSTSSLPWVVRLS